MSNPICWLCRCNLAYKEYDGTQLLDDDGSKPCLECLAEASDIEEPESFPFLEEIDLEWDVLDE